MKIQIVLISFFLLITENCKHQDKLNLKIVVEEAIAKSVIGRDPIIVANKFSAKIYSKLDLKHPVWNNLKKEELIIIPKNSELVEKLWGNQAKENGLIVFRTAEENKYNEKKLRYVLNGKEISKKDADTISMKNVNSFIIIKDRKSDECVAFINSLN